jgi:hypothetical protein
MTARVDLLKVVCREDDGLLLGHLPDHPSNFMFLVGVQSVGGLIHDEVLGVMKDALGKADPLPESLGQGTDALVTDILKKAPLHGLPYAVRLLPAPEPSDVCHEVQEPQNGHVRINGGILGEISDRSLCLQGIRRDVMPPDDGRSCAWGQKAGEHPHGCRFACGVGSQEAQNFPGPHGKGYVVDRFGLPEILGEVPRFDHKSRPSAARMVTSWEIRLKCSWQGVKGFIGTDVTGVYGKPLKSPGQENLPGATRFRG